MKIDHVAIVVSNLEEAIAFYEKLGLVPYEIYEDVDEKYPEDAEAHHFRACAMMEERDGVFHLWLMEPKGDSGPLHKFLETKGPGMHHLAFSVDGIESESERIQADGVRFVRPVHHFPDKGFTGGLVHPKDGHGVLVELAEHDPPSDPED